MASTSYLVRCIYKAHTTENDFTGTYRLLVKAKSMPSPISTPNTVESTTFEDDVQTFEMGIKTSDSKEITGNLEKEYLDNLDNLEGQKLDIIQLYGTQGVGEVAKYAYVGQAVASISDVSGTDSIVEMSATIVPNTAARKVTDELNVVDNGDGTFTVSAGSVNPDVTLNHSNLSVVVNRTAVLRATTIPGSASVTWTTSDDTVAEVANGVVTGVAVGTATITATITVDGHDYSDTCAVTVSAGV